jgi:hypothetical protein
VAYFLSKGKARPYHLGNGENTTHKHGDDLGMIYCWQLGLPKMTGNLRLEDENQGRSDTVFGSGLIHV